MMSAKDYRVFSGLYNAYIVKVSKHRHNLMTDDRREITNKEVTSLIDWWLNRYADEGEGGVQFDSFRRKGMKIIIKFERKEE